MNNHLDRYWDKKWQTTANEFKPNPFALKALDHIEVSAQNKPLALLDLGCGDGKDSLFFAHHGMKVTALDISETALQNIKNNNSAIVTQKQNFENLMLYHNNFDVIYAHLSLH